MKKHFVYLLAIMIGFAATAILIAVLLLNLVQRDSSVPARMSTVTSQPLDETTPYGLKKEDLERMTGEAPPVSVRQLGRYHQERTIERDVSVPLYEAPAGQQDLKRKENQDNGATNAK